MATPRQSLIEIVASKIAQRNFHAWLYLRGEENGLMAKKKDDFAKDTRNDREKLVFSYVSEDIFSVQFCSILEGTAKYNKEQWYYYMEITDKAYVRLAKAIQRRSVSLYLEKIRIWQEQTLLRDFTQDFEAIALGAYYSYDKRYGHIWIVEKSTNCYHVHMFNRLQNPLHRDLVGCYHFIQTTKKFSDTRQGFKLNEKGEFVYSNE